MDHLIQSKIPLTLTPSAIHRVNELLSLKKDAVGISFGVKRRGCNGYSYDLSYLECPSVSSDAVFYDLIAVDPMTLAYLEEINIDWVEEGLNEYVKIQSPKETAQCGCGESFTI